jgi:hypothetical protein
LKKSQDYCHSVKFYLRNRKHYRYLSAVYNQNRNLFDWSYTVGGENYATELSGTFENIQILKEKKKIDEDEAREFLRRTIERS